MNNNLNSYIGKKVVIHAYKYSGWLYRAWEFPIVLEETNDYIVLCSNSGEILTSEFKSTRVFKSKFDDFRIWIFFKDQWFNLYIYQKNNKYIYYINIASPFIVEESAFKYVDLDIDFKCCINSNNNVWNELDVNEFKTNSVTFKYPQKLIDIVYDVEQRVKFLNENNYLLSNFDLNWINKTYSKFKYMMFKKRIKNKYV